MKTMKITICLAIAFATSLSRSPLTIAQSGDQALSLQDRVGLMKASLAMSKDRLKKYQWIETTTILVKGEEKSSTQKQCYYGADGQVQKITIDATPPPAPRRGIIGRIAAKKKEELTDYMKQAIELVRQYVPPEPEAIQKVKDAGKASIAILDPGKRIRLDFNDYLMPGDKLGAEMTLAENRLAGINVSTFLDGGNSKKDPVTLAVRMGTLDDGTTYPAESTLDAKAKDLKVVVTNSGYRKAG